MGVDQLELERRERIKSNAEKALADFANHEDDNWNHSAGYDILRHAKAGRLQLKENFYDHERTT